MKKLNYIITFLTIITITFLFIGCSHDREVYNNKEITSSGINWSDMEITDSLDLKYAEKFSVDYYDGGYALVTIMHKGKFLVVPEGKEPPLNLDNDITVLKKPINNIYLTATSTMGLIDALDSIDRITMSGTQKENWYIENAVKAMEDGSIVFAGKYNNPDYELIQSKNCELSIQSTMVEHKPEVKEKLEEIGIPVLIELSSYESHPLGRTEWIKLYGLLFDKEDEAEDLFNKQIGYMDEVAQNEASGKTVAYFYISSSGQVVARRTGDYISKMIDIAGGKYIFDNLGDPESALSTVKLEMEEFYSTAKDADYIIYNSTIDGNVGSIEDLISKNELLKDFKAVKENNVWCTNQNFFQDMMNLGAMISDINQLLSSDENGVEELDFVYKLK